ncbi:hypothetical protein [Synechococcus sp. SYN20]|uniref:hypothetical protein n=1 Tax=Synechococcus sp. SYN20 TaxID=1050714 RepID=UPI0016458B83|nr:hypothetical protein [Synechococcus sp. SYN20]
MASNSGSLCSNVDLLRRAAAAIQASATESRSHRRSRNNNPVDKTQWQYQASRRANEGACSRRQESHPIETSKRLIHCQCFWQGHPDQIVTAEWLPDALAPWQTPMCAEAPAQGIDLTCKLAVVAVAPHLSQT